MKKQSKLLISILISMLMLSGITAYAVEARFAYVTSVTSTLTISSNTAYCVSVAKGNSTVTKIEGTQFLEKKNGSKWETVGECEWDDSSNRNSLTMSNSKSSLGSGTYRVRAVFTVYCGSDSEEVEKISKEETI